MFREMRRNKQALSEEECREILARCTSGTLAVLGDGGYPYAVPLSYVFNNGHIYFHCARSGHKLDAVRACDKVSFCVIDRDEVIPEKFTTKYRSVIVFGRAREVTDPEEIVGRASCAHLPGSIPPTRARTRSGMRCGLPARCACWPWTWSISAANREKNY